MKLLEILVQVKACLEKKSIEDAFQELKPAIDGGSDNLRDFLSVDYKEKSAFRLYMKVCRKVVE